MWWKPWARWADADKPYERRDQGDQQLRSLFPRPECMIFRLVGGEYQPSRYSPLPFAKQVINTILILAHTTCATLAGVDTGAIWCPMYIVHRNAQTEENPGPFDAHVRYPVDATTGCLSWYSAKRYLAFRDPDAGWMVVLEVHPIARCGSWPCRSSTPGLSSHKRPSPSPLPPRPPPPSRTRARTRKGRRRRAGTNKHRSEEDHDQD